MDFSLVQLEGEDHLSQVPTEEGSAGYPASPCPIYPAGYPARKKPIRPNPIHEVMYIFYLQIRDLAFISIVKSATIWKCVLLWGWGVLVLNLMARYF